MYEAVKQLTSNDKYLDLDDITFRFPNPNRRKGLCQYGNDAIRNTALLFLSGVTITVWDPERQFGIDPPKCPHCKHWPG